MKKPEKNIASPREGSRLPRAALQTAVDRVAQDPAPLRVRARDVDFVAGTWLVDIRRQVKKHKDLSLSDVRAMARPTDFWFDLLRTWMEALGPAVAADATVKGDLRIEEGELTFVEGDLTVGGNLRLCGTLIVRGSLQVRGDLLAFGDEPSSGRLAVFGDARCAGLGAMAGGIVTGTLHARDLIYGEHYHEASCLVAGRLCTPLLIDAAERAWIAGAAEDIGEYLRGCEVAATRWPRAFTGESRRLDIEKPAFWAALRSPNLPGARPSRRPTPPRRSR